MSSLLPLINSWHACTVRDTVVVLCVCLSVRTYYSGSTWAEKYNERYHCVKHQICVNIKMVFYLKFSCSKVTAFFTYTTSAEVAICS